MTIENFEQTISPYIPLPMCIVNGKGKVEKANAYIDQVFIYDDIETADFFALTGVKTAQLREAAEKNIRIVIERNGKIFRLLVTIEGEDEELLFFVLFDDITKLESIKGKYKAEKTCVCRINIDNYDELPANTAPEQRTKVMTSVETEIRKWATEIEGSLSRLHDDEYIIYFPQYKLSAMIEKNFDVLNKVRSIETEIDFPMSLSIGLGCNGQTLPECQDFANSALDLALGRGGDQVVIKNDSDVSYYGGKTQSFEKNNKGKSRVIAHGLKALIRQSKKVFIMGHKNSDMDAFGSSLGIYRLCRLCDREAYIVISTVNNSLQLIYNQAEESEQYNFIDGVKAKELIDEDCLIIVVDTHRISYVDTGELLEMTSNLAVIDHHRRAEDFIKDATLTYIESYASSTAELVTEILQYSGQKKMLVKLEAEALLAGMTIDTNRFAVKTGVRTFEAAAYLRRSGADTTEVKRFFQTDMDAFKTRAKCIAAAKFYDDGVATSVCEGENLDAQVINSQVADELLNIRGIKASFVAGRNQFGTTVISARSLGEVNVQVIMEKLGGGGHLTTAGAQVSESPEEVIEKVREIVRN
ncbi:MAG: DHH family phosphoesterase [Peptostreptococcaceae bacterium]|nr:DHH family phosphoesterase [Peptostreptococcaceae bacterium]MDY5739421.1 DHH family phosphoesterase [Anaerovoracaceae bacterium]